MLDPSIAGSSLGEALHYLRLSGAFYCRSELSAPWGIDLPALPGSLMFHVVTSGLCWLEVEGHVPVCLKPGDLGLVPHGRGHRLRSAPDAAVAPLFDLSREHVSDCYELLRHGGGGDPTHMICGAVEFDHPAAQQLIGLLPEMIQVDMWSSAEADWLQSSLRLMAAEARELKPGGETIVTRLCDILVIQAIRTWLAEDPAAQTGWLGALRDEHIGRAIARIHRDPEHAWSVAALAEHAAMSRSTFAARFTTLVGETPMRYVTRWRMHKAATLLREGDLSMTDVALRFGYQSEAAFHRAFKRTLGMTPGAARRRPASALAAHA